MLDTKIFLSAIDQLEQQGIAKEITVKALKEAFETIVKKKHVEGLPDLMVRVDIVPEEGRIDIFNIKNVVEEVEDDAIEISLEEAQEVNPDVKIGDQVEFKIELDDFTKQDAMKFKTILKQKIKEAEKQAILTLYADKVDEIIVGYVEKNEPRYTLLNIDRTSVLLHDKEKIGDETFEIGQAVKVYLAGVGSNGENGITISRACPGFLKRLFEEEIPDVFNGYVVIKDIAREAGERSKVSVYTDNINIDPVGACIGQGGQKIQRICQQLNREKIDIIQFHHHKGLFVSECLKPAEVVGAKILEDGSVIAIVKDGDLKVAIGRRGVNARLAVKLAGCKIDIKEESLALSEGIEFLTIEEMKKEDEILLRQQRQLKEIEKLAQLQREYEENKQNQPVVEEEFDDYDDDFEEEVFEEEQEEQEVVVQEEEKQPVVEEVNVVVEEEKKPEEEEVVEYVPVIMQPKVSLADLEKQIEEEKKKKNNQNTSYKKKNQKDETVVEVKKETTQRMDIYTQEELDEFEYEDEDDYIDDEDIDYDEYDEYYEDN